MRRRELLAGALALLPVPLIPNAKAKAKVAEAGDQPGGAMDLLNRVADLLRERGGAAPDDDWWKEYFTLTRTPMILTEDGWERPEAAQSWREYLPGWEPLDEVRFDG